MRAALMLVRARARRPGRWLAAVLGLAVATAFACAVAGEATITGDRAARAVLRSASPLSLVLRLTAQGPATPSRTRQAEGLLGALGVRGATDVVLLDPVRLDGVIVRPAGIAPLSRWVGVSAARTLGACRARACPVLDASPGRAPPRRLTTDGATLVVTGRAGLASAVPLAFAAAGTNEPPILLTGDPAGLDRVAGLSGVYRTESWVAMPGLRSAESWQLAGIEARWQHVQAGLPATGRFALSAPFDVLDSARAAAAAAPRRLLLVGGAALAALAGFLILSAYALRHERAADVRRLAAAGARSDQRVTFAFLEAGVLAAAGLLAGIVVGALATGALAAHAGIPAGAVLARGPINPGGVRWLLLGWLAATALVAIVLLLPSGHVADVLAIAAAAALALTLTRGGTATGTLPVVLAPLACVCAGVLIFRAGAAILRGLERVTRDGPVLGRLAAVGLARAPTAPALAIAFVAVTVGLGGFALGYRATLLRGQADAAAQQVPLDALVSAGTGFITPTELAPLGRWRSLAGGPVLPVRRTQATLLSGASSATVPALGVPASGLTLIHGWRAGDGSAPAAVLARRLTPGGPVRTAGPTLSSGVLTLPARTGGGGAVITAELRDGQGTVRGVMLGTATPNGRVLRARVPAGAIELQALTVTAPTGLQATDGHQNAENPAGATQSATVITLGPLRQGRRALPFSGWRAVGSVSPAGRAGSDRLRVVFAAGPLPGVIRPAQPWDTRPLPVLADPATAAAAGPGGALGLTIDGLPVRARVVGIVRRFPTLTVAGSGVVIADEGALAGVLDASLPGAGAPDELWVDTPHPGVLATALQRPPLDELTPTFRAQVQRGLRADPVAVGVLNTLLAGAAVGLVLAVLGLLVALTGALRDPRAERELSLLGLGPRGRARELRWRIVIAAGLGLVLGVAVAIALTRLAVGAVGAAGVAVAGGLVTVTPWGTLAVLALAVLAAFGLTAWLASGALVRGETP